MALEYIVGPVLALLVSMKFSDMQLKKQQAAIDAMNARVEKVIQSVTEFEEEVPKKLMATVMPVATAVHKLNQQIGL
jgi:hypothetical protein